MFDKIEGEVAKKLIGKRIKDLSFERWRLDGEPELFDFAVPPNFPADKHVAPALRDSG